MSSLSSTESRSKMNELIMIIEHMRAFTSISNRVELEQQKALPNHFDQTKCWTNLFSTRRFNVIVIFDVAIMPHNQMATINWTHLIYGIDSLNYIIMIKKNQI